MNYRHIYHAGNFADVFKHLLLVLCLDHLCHKDAPFFVLDAHAGRGVYDLHSQEALKTGECGGGIEKLMNLRSLIENESARLYLAQIEKEWKRKHYPGSSLIAARLLRSRDRLLANELHPEDAGFLKHALKGFKNARVGIQDACEAVRAHVPPPERRGLVLIDPPFEKKDEFARLGAQMAQWEKRWETGVYILWFPIKDRMAVEDLYKSVLRSHFKKLWICEYGLTQDVAENKLRSAGLLVMNPPYRVPERMEAAMADIAPILEADFQTRWLRR